MRKFVTILALILAMSMMLFGCGNSTEETEATTEPTQATHPTEATEPEATEETGAEPSIPHETHAPESSITTQPDYTPYYDLLAHDKDGNTLRDAMNCVFTEPEQLNLAYVFYGSLTSGGWDTISEESAAKLEEKGFTKNLELQIRSTKDLNDALNSNFGISLKDVKSGIPESWVYIKEDDCYYTNHSDALGFSEYTITWVDQISEDRVDISYTIESGSWYDTASGTYLDHPNMILILRKTEDGTYQMVSNYVVPSK